jgi:multidrug efflux pump
VFGLGFATILTLVITPAALMAIENLAERRRRLGARWFRRGKPATATRN